MSLPSATMRSSRKANPPFGDRTSRHSELRHRPKSPPHGAEPQLLAQRPEDIPRISRFGQRSAPRVRRQQNHCCLQGVAVLCKGFVYIPDISAHDAGMVGIRNCRRNPSACRRHLASTHSDFGPFRKTPPHLGAHQWTKSASWVGGLQISRSADCLPKSPCPLATSTSHPSLRPTQCGSYG